MHRLKQATVCFKCSGCLGEPSEGEPRSQISVQTGLVRPLVLKHCECARAAPPPNPGDFMYSCSRVHLAQFVLFF